MLAQEHLDIDLAGDFGRSEVGNRANLYGGATVAARASAIRISREWPTGEWAHGSEGRPALIRRAKTFSR